MKKFADYIDEIEEFYRQNGMQIDPVPRVNLIKTEIDDLDPFIQTGDYNPQTQVINLYIDKRQVKDILRSFCHELAHHNQYLSNKDVFMGIRKSGSLNENQELAKLEGEAYQIGNLLFRKWTETYIKR